MYYVGTPRGSVEVVIDTPHTLDVMADMGSQNPKNDYSGLNYFGFREGDQFHTAIVNAGAPSKLGGVQGADFLGVRVDRRLRTVDSDFIHELRHYVDMRNGLNFAPGYYDDLRIMSSADLLKPRSIVDAIKAYKRYLSEPMEMRARAAEKNPSYRGVVIGLV